MSSTNRSGVSYKQRKSISDYYITPIDKITEFLHEFIRYEPNAFDGLVLDPCAGGDENHPMSYPVALKQLDNNIRIHTLDIREDSLAQVKNVNYLNATLKQEPSTIITNPPFLLAQDIIRKSLSDVQDGGFVIMLLRLNFLEGKGRKKFWDKQLPKYCFVHHRRMSFTDDGKTDSVAYAHYVWQKGYNPEFTYTKVI